jgi:hypothetical protein
VRIYYDCDVARRVYLDRERFTAFLISQGMTEQQVNRLNIRFQWMLKERDCPDGHNYKNPHGCYKYGSTVYLFVHEEVQRLTPQRVNYALLHEVRHYMQHARDAAGFQQLLDEWKDLPYRQRPLEQDAFAFADQHKDQQFITID